MSSACGWLDRIMARPPVKRLSKTGCWPTGLEHSLLPQRIRLSMISASVT